MFHLTGTMALFLDVHKLTLHKKPTVTDVCPVAGWQPSFTALYQE